MKIFDQLFFIRLFFLLPWLIAPFISHPARHMCQLCQNEAAARSKIRSEHPSESSHLSKPHFGDR